MAQWRPGYRMAAILLGIAAGIGLFNHLRTGPDKDHPTASGVREGRIEGPALTPARRGTEGAAAPGTRAEVADLGPSGLQRPSERAHAGTLPATAAAGGRPAVPAGLSWPPPPGSGGTAAPVDARLDAEALKAQVADPSRTPAERSRSLADLLDILGTLGDDGYAAQALREVADQVSGEDRHRLMQALGRLGAAGGNDAITESVLGEGQGVSAVEAGRLLSYLDPTQPLQAGTAGGLIAAYASAGDADLRMAYARALAQVGGVTGQQWLVSQISQGAGGPEWDALVRAAGASASPWVFRELNRVLDQEAQASPGDSETKQVLREAILQMRQAQSR